MNTVSHLQRTETIKYHKSGVCGRLQFKYSGLMESVAGFHWQFHSEFGSSLAHTFSPIVQLFPHEKCFCLRSSLSG